MTTKSIGTASRDYSTITAWEADLSNTSVYVGTPAALGELYNDSDFDEAVTFDTHSAVSSATLQPATGEGHDGTEGTGVRILKSTSGSEVLYVNNAKFTVNQIEIDLGGDATTPSNGVYTGGHTVHVRYGAVNRCIAHGGYDDVASSFIGGFGANFGGVVNRCIVYDMYMDTNLDKKAYGGSIAGNGGQNADLNNLTIYNIRADVSAGGADAVGVTGDNTANKHCWNTIAVGMQASDTAVCFSLGASVDADYNLDDDASATTGTNNVNSSSAANLFVSTSPVDLHLKSGADAIDAGFDFGTTPTGVNIDIDGRDVDSNADTWDIGADEYVAAASAASGPSLLRARQRRTQALLRM